METRRDNSIAIVIPAYKPSIGLAEVVEQLRAVCVHPIVIVDDGSGPDYRDTFTRAAAVPGIRLLRHAVNLGKGAALKTAMNHVLCEMPEIAGIVTADADGQHHPEDILAVAAALQSSPESLVLGARNFGADVPLRSRFGNVLTRGIMHALLGRKLTDTQTGLRGIPSSFLPRLLRLETTGYEFELQMLIAAHELAMPFVEVPIRTIYEEGNKSSHFNPIVDSMKIYFVLLRFGGVSFLTALIDNFVFYLAWHRSGNVLASQVLGRTVAVCFNYWMVRRSVFYSQQRHKTVLPKYLLLVLASGTASYAGIRLLNLHLGISPVPAKLAVETVLFFVNFAVQRLFIFNRPREDDNGVPRSAAPALVFPALIAALFIGLLAAEVHGFRTVPLFQQFLWDPAGWKRFTLYIGAFLAVAVPMLLIFPWAFAAVVAAILLVLTVLSVGPLPVLATASFFLSACALGLLLLGRSKHESVERDLCATLLGTGLYIVAMTFLARIPIHYPLLWAAVLAAPIVLARRTLRDRLQYWASLVRGAELRGPWERAGFALVAFFAVAHWFVALEPEKSADGLAMHLAIPMNIAAHHALTFEPARFVWSVMPMGADWAYSIVYLLGGEYAARLLNYAMLLVVLALLYSAARRFVSAGTAFVLAASFAATPLVQLVTGSLFVENFMAAMVLGMAAAACLLGETGQRRYLFLAALLGGAAVTTKLGALAFVGPIAIFLVVEAAARWSALAPKPAAALMLAILLLAASAVPTYAIAYVKTGNPIYPFNNQERHSPLLNPTIDFNDRHNRIPVDWSTLYHLTFLTHDSYEGQNGSFGFQYLVMAPLALAGLLIVTRRPAVLSVAVAIAAGVFIMSFQPNTRYLYAALPLITIGFAALLGWLAVNDRVLYRLLLVFVLGAICLDAYFLPSSSYYHKDFFPRQPFSRAGKERYLEEAAPIRKVIEYYNRHHGNDAVLLTRDSSIAGIEGEVYENHWHTFPAQEKIRNAPNAVELFRLLKSWHVGYFISPKPAAGQEPIEPPSLGRLLSTCAAPVYEAGEYYLAQLHTDCESRLQAPRPPAQPTVVARPGFCDDYDPAVVFRGEWTRTTGFDQPARHTVSFTDSPGAEAVLAFEGRAITYSFAKAPNRGIAGVTIDGVDQGTVDLYAPKVEWQSWRKFCCFAPGRHEIVIRVTGQANPAATGRFVDLDAFVIE